MLKSLVLYTVVSTVFFVGAQIAGAGLAVALYLSFIGPPVVLLVIGIMQYEAISIA